MAFYSAILAIAMNTREFNFHIFFLEGGGVGENAESAVMGKSQQNMAGMAESKVLIFNFFGKKTKHLFTKQRTGNDFLRQFCWPVSGSDQRFQINLKTHATDFRKEMNSVHLVTSFWHFTGNYWTTEPTTILMVAAVA